MAASIPHPDERILILLPTTRDAERTRTAFSDAGLEGMVCTDLRDLCSRIAEGAGVALLTEELLASDREGCLAAVLREQPAWSDFPFVILAGVGAKDRPAKLRESMNVSLVERPVRMRSLLSVLRSALRSRRHQYEVRGHLAEREQQANALRDKEERLQFALAAGRLGSWDLDLQSRAFNCTGLCKHHFGRRADQIFHYDELLESIDPQDRARVQALFDRAVSEGEGFDVEHQVSWPDGSLHWVMMRGKATYGRLGLPLRMSGVSLDMTDRRRDEDSLRDADRKKDDFLALLAHELRNPLAPIRNGLQVLRRSQDHQVWARSQEMMERQLGHMVRLIDDLLDVSRINRNKMELRVEPVLLADVVRSALETAKPTIEGAEHELTVELPSERIILQADLTRLAQVLANLLTNSAKYTPQKGKIHLTAVLDNLEVAISVRDSGIGIPSDSLATIFDMFSQVDRSIERSTGGLGIGLALVKGLVEMHGGTVSAVSDGVGRGSEFIIRLPVFAVEAFVPDEGGIDDLPDFGAGPSRRILVVDDNQDSAGSMADMLRLFGNEVVVAHDGVEAVERAGTFRPEVVLMDVGMPRLNGLEATKRIREQPWGRTVKVIALTGWGQDGDRKRSSEAGCNGHLVKPVSLDDLGRMLLSLNDPASGE